MAHRLLSALALVTSLLLACSDEAPAAPATQTATLAATVATASPTASASPIATATATPTSTPVSAPVAPAAPAVPRPAAGVPAPRAVAGSTAVEIERGNLDRREIALTFDCGGHAGPTAEILAALREADVRVTFFLIGDWVRAYPALAQEIGARHEVANHSDTHPDYPSLTDAQIIADLEAADRAIIAATGRSTKPLWRAPSGARDNRVLAAAARAGWPLHIFWTLDRDADGLVTGDSGDWRPFTAQQVAANMLRAARLGNGVIGVSHCDAETTRAVLPEVLREIKAMGLRVVTVSEILR